MGKFTVSLNEDSESHFKTAIKAFDPDSKIIYNDKDNSYSIETKLSIEDLKSLTSVKTIVDSDVPVYPYGSGHGFSGYAGNWFYFNSDSEYLNYADM